MTQNQLIFRKPVQKDLKKIFLILSQWTDKDEVEKYCQRVSDEISGKTEFNTHYWVAEFNKEVVSVGGLSDILPKIKSFSVGKNPIELKILYLDNNFRGMGFGKDFLNYLLNIAINNKNDEMLIRTAKRYQDTAWGFYQKQGFSLIGYIDDGMAVFQKKL